MDKSVIKESSLNETILKQNKEIEQLQIQINDLIILKEQYDSLIRFKTELISLFDDEVKNEWSDNDDNNIVNNNIIEFIRNQINEFNNLRIDIRVCEEKLEVEKHSNKEKIDKFKNSLRKATDELAEYKKSEEYLLAELNEITSKYVTCEVYILNYIIKFIILV